MTPIRGWSTAFAATMVMLVVVALDATSDGADGARAGAIGAVALLSAAFAVLGVRALPTTRGAEALSPAADVAAPTAIPFLAFAAVGAAWATACVPSLAIAQCILCPLVWILLPRTRDAVVGNVLLTAAVSVGFLFSLSSFAQALSTIAVSQGLTLAGSLALGLWISRIADLSHERLRLLEGLRRAQAEVEELGRAAGAARERDRLSAEIHDTVAQDLTGLVMLAQRGRRELRAGEADRVAETLGMLEDNARDALTQTRAIVAATAPVEIADGIRPALARLAARFARETGIPAAAPASDPARGVPASVGVDRDAEVVLLRCAQEGLANVRSHAHASAVTITLTREGDDLVLGIRDDGRGFDPHLTTGGYGLDGMRRRLDAAGGRLGVASGPGGTLLTARIPARATAADPRPDGPVHAPAPAEVPTP